MTASSRPGGTIPTCAISRHPSGGPRARRRRDVRQIDRKSLRDSHRADPEGTGRGRAPAMALAASGKSMELGMAGGPGAGGGRAPAGALEASGKSMELGRAGAPGGAARLASGPDGPRGDPPRGVSSARQAAEVAAGRRSSRKRGAGGPVIVRAHRMNYARRQQYRRFSRAGEAGIGAAGTALLGLWAASVSAALVAVCLLIVAAALGLCARHWLSLARRSRG